MNGGDVTDSEDESRVGICAEANVTCASWAEALDWWDYDDNVPRHPRPQELDLTEVVAVFTASGDGLASDPNAETSLLLVVYAPPEGLGARSAKELLATGAIVVQVRIGPAGAQANAEEDADLSDDGHTVERVQVNGREAIFEEMTEQTGVNGYRLWWSDDVDEDHAVLVEVLADSEPISRELILQFVDEFVVA